MSQRTRTSAAVRRAIQHSNASIRELAHRYSINPKTVAKWRRRNFTGDLKTGPKNARSLDRARLDEAIILVFRLHVVLPLNDSLQALQSLLPQLARSSLHRTLQRHDLSLTARSRDKPRQRRPAAPAFGQVALNVTAVGPLQLLVGVESRSKFVCAQLYAEASEQSAGEFLGDAIASLPGGLESIVTPKHPLFLSASFGTMCKERNITHRIDDAAFEWNARRARHVEDVVSAAFAAQGVDAMGHHDGDRLRRALADFVAHYNTLTSFMALGGLSPQAYLQEHHKGGKLSKSQPTRPLVPSTHKTRAPGGARLRAPEDTREAILEAARTCLAHDGPEGLSLSKVARIAGVNRGTAYQYFETREKLIAAAAESVSDTVLRAVFGDPSQANEPHLDMDISAHLDRIANLAMNNPELCRGWLLQVLSSPDPSSDPFWREFQGAIARFAQREVARDDVDAEVLSVILLAGIFLWPVMARPQAKHHDLGPLAARFAQEALRLSMYGTLHPEKNPEIAKRLRDRPADKTSGAKDTK